jgi:AraC-like DNA-binding protein
MPGDVAALCPCGPSRRGVRLHAMLLYAAPGMAVWPAAMIVWGPGFRSTAHRHHCVQLVMTLSGVLRARGGPEESWTKCGAALVRPDAVHEIDAPGKTVIIGFIDAESEIGAALSERITRDIACVPPHEVARWRAMLGPTPNSRRVERWLTDCLVRRKRVVTIHPRVRRVLAHLRNHRGLLDDSSLKTLAGIAGLSQSRFMHVFTESVGVPVRPYILWLRLQRAACDLMNSASVTGAAHAAGFSDAAHLTRTFRRMLGTTPTDIVLRNRVSHGLSVEPAAAGPGAERKVAPSNDPGSRRDIYHPA